MPLILTVLIVLMLLLINEAWWRRHAVHSELGRKFIHITVGSFVALWPFLLSWNEIKLLSVAFLVVVGVSKYLHVFRAIHSVQRPTWGELFFALAVGLTALITQDKWIYLTALLQMSLADGLAAIIGWSFGRTNQYHVLGYVKSVAGTLTFFVVSVILLVVYSTYSTTALAPGLIFGLAAGAALIENVGIHGLDNLLVPLLIAAVLSMS